MKEDDIIEELHKIREAIMKEAGGTPAAYAQYYFELGQKRLAAEKAIESKKGAAKTKPKTKARISKTGKQRRKTVVS